MPGMRLGGSSIIRLMYLRSDTRPSLIARASMRRPRCQVVRMVKKIAPTTSGNQPPLMILVRFAAKNVSSTVMNTLAPGIDDPQRLSPQRPEDDEREERVGGEDGAAARCRRRSRAPSATGT